MLVTAITVGQILTYGAALVAALLIGYRFLIWLTVVYDKLNRSQPNKEKQYGS